MIMENINSQTVDELKNDRELRPLFFDFVSKSFALGLTDSFEVSDSERVRFQRDYYASLLDLSSQIEKKVKKEKVLPIIHEITLFYLGRIGRIEFDTYNVN